jgi:ABC-type Fe3+-hydroxamate transport system substrate-binding protein
MDSTSESYPDDPEKVADKRESITVLLMRVDAEGCTIQGGHDYVSNMFADFGLVNVNPGYEEIRVEIPKEDDTEADTIVDESAESGVESSASAETDTKVDEGAKDGTEAPGAAESAISEAEAEISEAESEMSEGDPADSGTEADSKEFDTILSRNPDYIFVIYEGKERDAEKTYKAICEKKKFWNDLTAVRNRHVYTLPQNTFAFPPNDQWDLAYEYLYQMMFVM